MAENCFYMMHIKGDKNAIDEFVGMMKNGEMGRFFSVEAEMDSDHEAIVSGDCAWSLSSAVLLSGTNRLVEPTFLNKMRKLGLSIEAYTEEPVAGFEEHFVFDKGVIAIKETTDLATYAARNLSEKDLQNIAKEHNATTDAVIASIDDEVVQIGGYDWIFDGKPANAAVTAVLRERFLNFVEKEILESETGMYFIENDAWLQDDGFSPAELDSLAAKIFMDMDGLQMCTDLAEQMAWECSTERTELAEVLWNGDPEQGIAALEDVAVDDDDCIKQEWMGYKPGTPRFAVWKDFETNFSKDGVSLYELSGFDDYKVEYKDPGPTLSESEFNKLFGSDVLDENVQKDVSDVNRDDPGSEDER